MSRRIGYIAGPDGDMSWLSPYLGPNPSWIDATAAAHRRAAHRRSHLPAATTRTGGTDKEGGFSGTWTGPSFVVTHRPPAGPVDAQRATPTGAARVSARGQGGGWRRRRRRHRPAVPRAGRSTRSGPIRAAGQCRRSGRGVPASRLADAVSTSPAPQLPRRCARSLGRRRCRCVRPRAGLPVWTGAGDGGADPRAMMRRPASPASDDGG